MIYMESVITIRVPRALQMKMKKHKKNWSKEIRDYIETKIKAIELAELLDKIHNKVKRAKITSDSTIIIRQERDAR